jgi:hypothetical protein
MFVEKVSDEVDESQVSPRFALRKVASSRLTFFAQSRESLLTRQAVGCRKEAQILFSEIERAL